jgi:DNA (cytosine-5)-methyltransferase 1
VFGNPPTRGKAGERVTGPIAGCSNGGGANGPGRTADDADSLVWRGGDQANSEHCIDHAGTLNCDKGQQGGILAFTKSKRAQSTTDDETWVPGEVSPTMSCFDQGDTRATTVVAQGFTYSGYSNQPAWMTGDRTDCLPSSGHSDGSHQGVGVVAVVNMGGDKGGASTTEDGSCFTLSTNEPHAVSTPMAVRRLTPRECERLQGFPDDYTLVEYRKKTAADGPRYRALGNSMAVPVMRWIGERIAMVDRMA